MKRVVVAVLLLVIVTAGYSQQYVQKNDGLIPGFYQFKTGQKFKGYTFALLQTGTLGGAVYCFLRSDDEGWERKRDFASSAAEWEDFDKKARDAKDRGELVKPLLIAAGGVYAINLLDVVLHKQEKLHVSLTPTGKVQVAVKF